MPYSVLTEPVIPVLMPDGKEKNIGIREAFLEAHHIRDVSGSNPLERYALLRLLIAFAMDMLHPGTSYDRAKLLQAGKFDGAVFDDYIRLCEKDGPRFDLFDPEHPFLQSRYDEEMDKDKIKNVVNICPSLPQGNNHVFFDHRYETEHCLSAADAFRSMCAFYLFCFPVGAKGYPSGVNNTSPLYVVVLGNSLFETIVINMLSVAELGNIPYGIGSVPWRGDCKVIPKKAFANVSAIEAYTWIPRRITLIRDNDGMVRTLYFQPGHNFIGNDLWKDPHVPYRKNKDNIFISIKPASGRLLWRDVASLTYDRNHKNYYQPCVLSHLMNVFDEDEIPYFINVRIMGLVLENNAKYVIWYEDVLSLPVFLLNDDGKAEMFRDDVRLIEALQSVIYSNVQRRVDRPRDGSPNGEHEVATQCQQYFLKAAHDLLFGSGLTEIRNGLSAREHQQSFDKAVGGLVRDTMKQVLHTSGNDTYAMIRQIEAEKEIWKMYHKTVKEREELYAGS